MSELARHLRRQMEGGFPHGNPLINIGVSAQILDLGLTEDELYDYIVKGVARQLVMRIHPDRVGADQRPDLELLQRKYNQAYEELQERQTFVKALAEFRNLKAEERSETRLLRRSLHETREILESYRSREVYITEGERRLKAEREEFEKNYRSQINLVPRLEAQLEYASTRLERVRGLTNQQHRRIANLTRYLNFLTAGRNPVDQSIHVFEAKWVIVAALVPDLAVTVPLPTGMFDRWSTRFRGAIRHLEIPKEVLKGVKAKWLERFEELNTPIKGETNQPSNLRLHVLELSVGKPKVIYGYNKMADDRVLGSMPPSPMTFGRRDLTHMASKDTMFEHLVPFLTPGGLLVSERFRKVVKEPLSGKHSPLVFRETRKIILAAG